MEIISPPQTKNRKSLWLKYATILVFLILAFTAVLITSPPESKGLGESSELFSAQRAFLHTEEIAQAPHMTGSLEHDRVCSYIFDELERIGLQTQIQSTPFVNFDDYILYSNITNVIGRLPGTDNSKAIMMVGHYDTQPHTPGAADDGVAVAAMLEAAETLKNHHKLKNDIIFLFTDAEEVGLIGAEAFAEEHPWMEDVGLILNLEARGNKGPAVAFEVSDQNGWLIKEFIKGVERPFAASMMYEVY
ncbi:MAG: M20/M25/M40 family metallo-hydrolase, partial [Bacteroidales bacterium]